MILIVSPHFDDGTMSCADHALFWRGLGHDVCVLTVFSSSSSAVSRLLAGSDPSALQWDAYMQGRLAEERRALAVLGISGKCAGLIDAGFRGSDHPLVGPRSRLRLGAIPSFDSHVLEEAIEALKPHIALASTIVLPLAVGGHIDHVIARRAGEALTKRDRIAYYADMPYAVRWRYWHATAMAKTLTHQVSRSHGSVAKRRALEAYVSQEAIVKRMSPFFPELLILKPRTQAQLRISLNRAIREEIDQSEVNVDIAPPKRSDRQ